MKGIKIGIIGVCVSLLGIAFAMNNFVAICGASIGLLLAFVGCFVKDKNRRLGNCCSCNVKELSLALT